MIEITNGNLLEAPVSALVNTVNTEGVMGKGIALQFRNMFPDMFKDYAAACKAGHVELGKMHIYHVSSFGEGPEWIINFPTKGKWRSKSKVSDIEAGLDDLVINIKRLNIQSIAVPPLGCGNGGLDWSVVLPIIEDKLKSVQNVRVLVYPPSGAPDAKDMPNMTEKPKLSVAMATLIMMLSKYREGLMDPFITVLEAQKLMYFLQEAGENLRLNYKKHYYGPYALNLRHVLNRMEKHYIEGFGDGDDKPSKPLFLLEGATEESADLLKQHSDVAARVKRVEMLIDGFEDTYGMELLSSVHWVMCRVPHADESVSIAVKAIQEWNLRKSQTMKPAHIEKAWNRLHSQRWHSEARSAPH
ncbi:type II toxin-antitoxin system antitoxin DNA ADP-ribosyl glycohydrolase DarG [Comamonas odontotermitis]|uniref:type II toxin-antitoxin system antitoxin DNA ADP-ribosyl glycohydrolase DarG n=1 Tax=Comamonas odontotermitis TaxID=379895 RepID=UPI001CC7246C|nr:macro domain-containing protein [Comamonas odontotermitis]UBB18332.1 macro domain-containing protein [Comamonas odontotermitis]